MSAQPKSSNAPLKLSKPDQIPSPEGISNIVVPEFICAEQSIPAYTQLWKSIDGLKRQSDSDLGEAAWLDGDILQRLKPLPGTGSNKQVPHGEWGKFLVSNQIAENYALLCRKIRVGFPDRNQARRNGFRAMEISIWPSRGQPGTDYEEWLISDEGVADTTGNELPERSADGASEPDKSNKRRLRNPKAINNDRVEPVLYQVKETMWSLDSFMKTRAGQKHGLAWNPDKKVPRNKQAAEYDRMIKTAEQIAKHADTIIDSLKSAKDKAAEAVN